MALNNGLRGALGIDRIGRGTCEPFCTYLANKIGFFFAFYHIRTTCFFRFYIPLPAIVFHHLKHILPHQHVLHTLLVLQILQIPDRLVILNSLRVHLHQFRDKRHRALEI
jgi:hypothetical protein